MMYVVCFILGMATLKTFQIIYNTDNTYRIFKYSEIYSMLLVLETEVWRKQCLKIIEVVYNDVDKQEDYEKITKLINKRFEEVQQSVIKLIKERLPYEIKYSTLQESEPYIKADLMALKGESDVH